MRSCGHKKGIEMSIIGSRPVDIHEPNRLADKMMVERYSFNADECPWNNAYWASYQENEATYYKNNYVPDIVKEYRYSWLAGCAQGLLYARKGKLMTLRAVTPASMWGVVAAAILEGTYACIFTSDKSYLWNQAQLTGRRLGITHQGLPDCTPRNIQKQLEANTNKSVPTRLWNREKLSENYHSPYVYYVRTAGRKMFVRDEIVKQAVYVARNIRKDTLLAEPLQKQWYEVLGHTDELINYFLEMGKGSPIIPKHTSRIRISM